MSSTLKPSDLIVLGSDAWTVKGVFLGATGQQNAVHLEHTSKTAPSVCGEPVESFVPLEMLNALIEAGRALVFTPKEPGPSKLAEPEYPKWWKIWEDALVSANSKEDFGSYHYLVGGRVSKSHEGPPMEQHARQSGLEQITAAEAKAFLSKP